MARQHDEPTRPRTRPPTHPGGILARHYLVPLGLSLTQAAGVLGLPRTTLARLIHGQCAVTPAMAVRLAAAWQTTPELWLHLQRTYDAWQASHSDKK